MQKRPHTHTHTKKKKRIEKKFQTKLAQNIGNNMIYTISQMTSMT